MRVSRTLLAACLILLASCSSDFRAAESAVRSLEEALTEGDVEAAVDAKDFVEEARLLLQRIDSELVHDEEVVQQTAEALELAFRHDIDVNGTTDFGELDCTFEGREMVSDRLIKLVERCVFPDGGDSVGPVYAAKGDRGWRVVTVAD